MMVITNKISIILDTKLKSDPKHNTKENHKSTCEEAKRTEIYKITKILLTK